MILITMMSSLTSFHNFNILICIFLVLLSTRCYGEEVDHTVPKEMVPKPLMDPIPTLPEITHKVYFDIEIGDSSSSTRRSRIVLGLFETIAPQLVENFYGLCACDRGNSKLTGKPLCYKGSKFHRVIPNFMIQGGDFTHSDGTGGESIYGTDLEDEGLLPSVVRHSRKYVLSMANKGRRNTITSQFFITTVKTQWLDNINVVIGLVLEGENVVQQIDKLGGSIYDNNGTPQETITIVDSGTMDVTDRDQEHTIHYSRQTK